MTGSAELRAPERGLAAGAVQAPFFSQEPRP